MSTSHRFPYPDAMIRKCVIMPNLQPFNTIGTRRDEDIAPYETDSVGHVIKPPKGDIPLKKPSEDDFFCNPLYRYFGVLIIFIGMY